MSNGETDTLLNLSFDERRSFEPCYFRLNREVKEDLTLGDKVIPKGSVMIIPVYYIHHHPDYYPEPELFIPER